MCKYCGNDTCCGNCWSSLISCLEQLVCCCDCNCSYPHPYYDIPISNVGIDIGTKNPYAYKQTEPLLHIDEYKSDNTESDNSSTHSSDDPDRLVVTINPNQLPSKQELIVIDTMFNCWSWANNPISNLLANSWPAGLPNEGTLYNIQTLMEATKIYLNEMLTKNKIIEYTEITGKNTCVIDFMKNNKLELKQKLIWGLRVSKYNKDFHYIRWYLGEWSEKEGTMLGIFKGSASAPVYDFEPDSMWAAATTNLKNPKKVKFPRNPKTGKVQKESVYASPTIYYLITLPLNLADI
ncbi:MAG: hypothetical protein IJI84_04215 [Clostridia bacterium]|nr:hypothetical protein [Clostridia bacterium]